MLTSAWLPGYILSKSWLSLKSSALWAVLIFSSVDLFSLLSEWIILSSDSLVQINGDLRMGPHKPPRASTSLCHCHGDSSEWPRYMAGLVRDTQCFLVVPQSHMDTVAASSSIKDMKEIDFSFPWISSLSFQPAPYPHLYSSTFIFLLFFFCFHAANSFMSPVSAD